MTTTLKVGDVTQYEQYQTFASILCGNVFHFNGQYYRKIDTSLVIKLNTCEVGFFYPDTDVELVECSIDTDIRMVDDIRTFGSLNNDAHFIYESCRYQKRSSGVAVSLDHLTLVELLANTEVIPIRRPKITVLLDRA